MGVVILTCALQVVGMGEIPDAGRLGLTERGATRTAPIRLLPAQALFDVALAESPSTGEGTAHGGGGELGVAGEDPRRAARIAATFGAGLGGGIAMGAGGLLMGGLILGDHPGVILVTVLLAYPYYGIGAALVANWVGTRFFGSPSGGLWAGVVGAAIGGAAALLATGVLLMAGDDLWTIGAFGLVPLLPIVGVTWGLEWHRRNHRPSVSVRPRTALEPEAVARR